MPLALAKAGVGEAKGSQQPIACLPMFQLLLGPGEKTLALSFEEFTQRIGEVILGECGLILGEFVELDERQLDAR